MNLSEYKNVHEWYTLACRNLVMFHFFSSFPGIWCYDVFLLPQNGGGQRGKFHADGCSIAWEFYGVWMDTYRVVLFPSQLTVQIDSAICDCWVISLSRFCWLEMFGVAFIFCDAWSSAVYGIPELRAVVSSNLGPPTAFCTGSNPAKYMIFAGICVVFPTW